MKDEKSAADHTLDVTLKRVDELHQQVEELKTQLLTKGNHKNRSIQGLWDQVLGRTADGRFSSRQSASRTEADGGRLKSLKNGRNIVKIQNIFISAFKRMGEVFTRDEILE